MGAEVLPMFAAAGPFGLGPAELAIILVIVVVMFGATRLKDLGGSLGQGIKEFRAAVKEDEDETVPPAARTDSTPVASSNGGEVIAAVKCPSCGALNAQGAKFCSSCGATIAAPVSQS
jgi:sec-independent protein translocase protein TatA